MTTMNRTEALAAGYEYCGIAGKDYQSLIEIKELQEIDLIDHELVWVLASRDCSRPTIKATDIREMIADNMESDWGNDTGDDTEDVYNAVMKLDFEETAKMINDALSFKWSRTLTKIRLTL
jgi:hypothetical protein